MPGRQSASVAEHQAQTLCVLRYVTMPDVQVLPWLEALSALWRPRCYCVATDYPSLCSEMSAFSEMEEAFPLV